MKRMRMKFNKLVHLISFDICSFDDWSLRRIDYFLNIDFDELGDELADVDVADVVALICSGKIPYGYSRRDKYLVNGCSFYLVGKSANINIYWKGGDDKPSHYSQTYGRRILRVEIQCLRSKTSNLKYEIGEDEMIKTEFIWNLIVGYWRRIVGLADWYSSTDAKRLVRESVRRDRAKALTQVLEQVSKYGSVADAKRSLKGKSAKLGFDRSLRELEQLGINPVTIPVSRGVKHIKILFVYCWNRR